MNEPDERDILRERFRADLARPVSERYYSEDELIAIFDSAGDYYDDPPAPKPCCAAPACIPTVRHFWLVAPYSTATAT